MNLFIAITIGVLFAAGTYMMLRPNLIRIVLGMGLYSNAVNLLMIACGGYVDNPKAPFIDTAEGASNAGLMDPLPPDIILTAIVISFAVGALFLTVCYRVYLDHGTDNPEELPNHEDPDEGPDTLASDDAANQASNPSAVEGADDSDKDDDKDQGDTHSDIPNVIAELAQPHPDSPRENVPKETNKTD